MNDVKSEDVLVELTMLEEAITRAVVAALRQDRAEREQGWNKWKRGYHEGLYTASSIGAL